MLVVCTRAPLLAAPPLLTPAGAAGLCDTDLGRSIVRLIPGRGYLRLALGIEARLPDIYCHHVAPSVPADCWSTMVLGGALRCARPHPCRALVH